jgi:hypothetical protein
LTRSQRSFSVTPGLIVIVVLRLDIAVEVLVFVNSAAYPRRLLGGKFERDFKPR